MCVWLWFGRKWQMSVARQPLDKADSGHKFGPSQGLIKRGIIQLRVSHRPLNGLITLHVTRWAQWLRRVSLQSVCRETCTLSWEAECVDIIMDGLGWNWSPCLELSTGRWDRGQHRSLRRPPGFTAGTVTFISSYLLGISVRKVHDKITRNCYLFWK